MKILYVTTVSETIPFFTSHIKMLLAEGHSVDMACKIGKPIDRELLDLGCNVYNIEFSRSPLNLSNYSAYKNLKKVIKENGYDIVHTHTPVASVCTRLACKGLKKVKVMYTAHGFHFYKGAPLQNWLIYYPVEKWLSRYTDVLITINKEDYERAIKDFKSKNVEYIPGVGLQMEKINKNNVEILKKRKDLGIPADSIVLLSVGELNKNKNHETVIKAIAKLKNPKIYYLICGIGPLDNLLRDLVIDLGMEKQILLLGFRNDIFELYKSSDIFVFPSFREGLSVALMEAMACGLPVLCSNIRGNTDLIEGEKGGYLVDPKSVEGFKTYIVKLQNDSAIRNEFGKYNKLKVKQFSIESVLKKVKKIYDFDNYD